MLLKIFIEDLVQAVKKPNLQEDLLALFVSIPEDWKEFHKDLMCVHKRKGHSF